MNIQVIEYQLRTQQQIVLFDQSVQQRIVQITRSVNSIGLDQQVYKIQLDNPSVSTSHCVFQLDTDRDVLIITDKSKNGTIIFQSDTEFTLNKQTFEVENFSNTPAKLMIRTGQTSYVINIWKSLDETQSFLEADFDEMGALEQLMQQLQNDTVSLTAKANSECEALNNESRIQVQKIELTDPDDSHLFSKPKSASSSFAKRQTRTAQMLTENDPEISVITDPAQFIINYQEDADATPNISDLNTIIPVSQTKKNYDFQKQIQPFKLEHAAVWIEGISFEQVTKLKSLKTKIQEDFDPCNVQFFFTTKFSKSTRLLMSMISGIPVLDAISIDKYEPGYQNVAFLLNPSIYDITDQLKDKVLLGLIKDNYKVYKLHYVSCYIQHYRLLISAKQLIVGQFSAKRDVVDQETLAELLHTCYFLAQFGPKIVLLLPKYLDYLFSVQVIEARQFKTLVRPVVGKTCSQRLQHHQKQTGGEFLMVTQQEVSFDFDARKIQVVQFEVFVRAALVGIGKVLD
ncbi:Conserved_hypothetical protein [Hexamita inflata]|uniref:FHA domain-containing protein n=1 Tax=Hexamita inflata TaxID=28002 RepID=A0AA86V2Y0_9EUKA|nr:Conserved hypothetical protein [Hexamita inflata]